MSNLRKSICQFDKDKITQGCSWAWFIFFIQVPFVFWYVMGGPAIHPIVIMLPLIGWLNFKVEKKGVKGIGIRVVKPGHSLMLAIIFSTLSVIGWLFGLYRNGSVLIISELSTKTVWELVESFLVAVFIVALWEEFVNRGYIQTRLQASWGFGGVIVTTMLFAAMHLPCALLDFGNNLHWILLRFLETGLLGFVLGFTYWRSGSVLTTITIHGLYNFTVRVFSIMSGFSYQQVVFNQPSFQLVWLAVQVGITAYLCHTFYKDNPWHTGDPSKRVDCHET